VTPRVGVKVGDRVKVGVKVGDRFMVRVRSRIRQK
jgi:hypothetical protein